MICGGVGDIGCLYLSEKNISDAYHCKVCAKYEEDDNYCVCRASICGKEKEIKG